jgi:hypothetical protein
MSPQQGEEQLNDPWISIDTACTRDDVSLVEQFIAACSPLEEAKWLEHILLQSITKQAPCVLTYMIEQKGQKVKTIKPMCTADGSRSKAILDILLEHGWDINWRDTTSAGPNAEPLLWHIVHDDDLVAWCLANGASVHPIEQEPLRADTITPSQYHCEQVLEKAAAKASVKTFELLRARGARLGWRPLHLAVQAAASCADSRDFADGTLTENNKALEERLAMVRHLIDEVGVDVNARDFPAGRPKFDRLGTPICYVAQATGLRNTRELVWLLLDRGADPVPGLEEAKFMENREFAIDVEAWRAKRRDHRRGKSDARCVVQ